MTVLALVTLAPALADCTVSALGSPADGAVALAPPRFRWDGDCVTWVVQLSATGAFDPASPSSAVRRIRSWTPTPERWARLAPALHPGGFWRVVGFDAAGVATASASRSLRVDLDVDQDGVGVLGGDCNDGDAGVYPGAPETTGDGVDQDCDGTDPGWGSADYALAGVYSLGDGPDGAADPAVRSCTEACAELFGGDVRDWACSTSTAVVDHRAYVDGWADDTHCTDPVDEGFSLAPPGGGYACGVAGCSYSALVFDQCPLATNACWQLQR